MHPCHRPSSAAVTVDASRQLKEPATHRNLAPVATERRYVAQRRFRRADAARDKLLKRVKRYAATAVRSAEHGVNRAVNQPLATLNVADVGLEILHFIPNA